jgi:hypothetical protein
LSIADLSSGDGFRRERILRTFSGAAPNSFFLAIAFRRLNDWVPQVREAAREKVPQIAEATPAPIVAEALFATFAIWNTWGRMQEADVQVLLGLITNKSLSDALKTRVMRSHAGPLSRVYSQICRVPVFDEHLVEVSREAVQPFVRAKAYRILLEKKVTWVKEIVWEWADLRYLKSRKRKVLGERKVQLDIPFIEVLNRAAIDSSPVVRRVAAELLIRELKSLGAESHNLARLFAADSYPSVAERGNFALKQLGQLTGEAG